MRRLFVLVFVCGFGAPAAAGTSAARGDLHRLETHDTVMGSSFSLVLYGAERSTLERAAAAAFEEAHRLDRLLSNYRPGSEWSAVNRDAAIRPVPISAELFALLARCLAYSRATAGAFDITVGPLIKVWGFYDGDGAMPRRAAVTAALRRIGYRRVLLDSSTRTVRFSAPGVELDPGGIGKGYAVDRMVEILKQHGVEAALVSASGSSMFAIGAPPGEPGGWPITIRAPRAGAARDEKLVLKDMSLSTSGGDEKFFRAAGRTYSHIIDPRTGYPARGTTQVSVIAPKAIDSEAWTKPFFINGRAWTQANRPAGTRVFVCGETPPACSWLE